MNYEISGIVLRIWNRGGKGEKRKEEEQQEGNERNEKRDRRHKHNGRKVWIMRKEKKTI